MLKLYTDQKYLTAENRKKVFPLLFDFWYLPNTNLLEKYQLVTNLLDCDIAVVPIDIAHFTPLDEFIKEALKWNKKVWIYSAGDYGKSVDSSVYTFRTSGFDSKLNKKTFIIPSFINDPFDIVQKDFLPIPKTAQPQIGFVGNASNSFLKMLKELLLYLKYNYNLIIGKLDTDFQSFYPSSKKRYQFLSLLQKSTDVKTNFVFRKKYRAGVRDNAEERKQTTLEFFENIHNNPYTFCLRGAGNFSVRFYETLAMGRIPFVVDTDFRLPLNDKINWEKHCIITKGNEIVQTLVNFHKNISSEDFELMQLNNRKLWLSYLEREAYFLNIYSIFKAKKE